MDTTTTLAIIVTILLTLMTMLMSFFIYQQGLTNKKLEKTNELLKETTERLIKLETEHQIMKSCSHLK